MAMMFSVQFVAAFVNYAVFSYRELFILLAWIPIFTIPYILIRKKFIYLIFVFLCFIESFVGLCHWIILKGPLTVISVFVLSNTNYFEASEFMELKSNGLILLVIPFLFLFVKTLITIPKIEIYSKRRIVIVLALLFSFSFIGENIFNNRLIRKGIPQTSKAVVSYFEEAGKYNLSERRKNFFVKTNSDSCFSRKQVFVLIIGESCNRNHMSLYGYKRKTNPLLEKRNDLIIFNNVVSPCSNTLFTIPLIISDANLENKKRIENSVTLIDVFRSAGYKTFWISNQSPIGVWDNVVFSLAKGSDIVKFVNIYSNSSFESTYIASYDEKLFGPFRQALDSKGDKKFIVLHLMGSHSSYSKRYPGNFNMFNRGKSDKEQTINEYDNSVLYNDFIINNLFNLLNDFGNKHSDLFCSAIYLSDHGENVYDDSENCGHNYSGFMSKSISEIPFILWISTPHRNKYNEMKNHVNLPFVSDDLFHTVLDLTNINCDYFNQSRSLFSKNYNSKRIRILDDNLDYDRK